MIQPALQFVASALGQYVRNKFGLNEEIVVLNHVIESNDSEPIENKNKIVITLINLDYQTLKPYSDQRQKLGSGAYMAMSSPQRFNIDILISLNFENYDEALKFLGAVLSFFQTNPSFNVDEYSNLPKGIEKLQLDIEQMTYVEMHNLWSAIGAKYKPSIVYKTRMVSIQEQETDRFDSAVNTTNINTN